MGTVTFVVYIKERLYFWLRPNVFQYIFLICRLLIICRYTLTIKYKGGWPTVVLLVGFWSIYLLVKKKSVWNYVNGNISLITVTWVNKIITVQYTKSISQIKRQIALLCLSLYFDMCTVLNFIFKLICTNKRSSLIGFSAWGRLWILAAFQPQSS